MHPSEYKKAEEYAEIVAKHLGISRDEALGRIVRHMLRTVDYETAKADDFRIDQAIISLIGANNLPKQDEHYYNPNYNAQYNQNYARDVDLGRQNAHSGKTPAEIKAYNQGVVTDIPKAFGNAMVGVYESAANLVNGEIFPQSTGYVPIERPFDYYHQDYGSALETLITIGGTALIGGAKTGAKNADNAANVKTVTPTTTKVEVNFYKDGEYSYNWNPTQKASSNTRFAEHWVKHGSEFPELKSANDYYRYAQNFMNNPPQGTLTKVRPNGDQLFYNPQTNIFGSKTKDDQIKTLFKPTDKMNYWNRQ